MQKNQKEDATTESPYYNLHLRSISSDVIQRQGKFKHIKKHHKKEITVVIILQFVNIVTNIWLKKIMIIKIYGRLFYGDYSLDHTKQSLTEFPIFFMCMTRVFFMEVYPVYYASLVVKRDKINHWKSS